MIRSLEMCSCKSQHGMKYSVSLRQPRALYQRPSTSEDVSHGLLSRMDWHGSRSKHRYLDGTELDAGHAYIVKGIKSGFCVDYKLLCRLQECCSTPHLLIDMHANLIRPFRLHSKENPDSSVALWHGQEMMNSRNGSCSSMILIPST